MRADKFPHYKRIYDQASHSNCSICTCNYEVVVFVVIVPQTFSPVLDSFKLANHRPVKCLLEHPLREEFCILGRKLLTQTCKFPKRLPLSADFPNLCETLEALPDFIYQCKNNR